MEIITNSAEETKEFGEKFSNQLKEGAVIALSGDLGAGKTTFIQGLAKGLGIEKRISSPTFILMRSYEGFYHIDLYRLEDNIDQEITNLGIKDIMREGQDIVVVEWAEKAKGMLPKNTIFINIENLGKDKRKITIKK